MRKVDAIVSCIGKVNQRSAAILCNTTVQYVCLVWANNGYVYRKRNALKRPKKIIEYERLRRANNIS